MIALVWTIGCGLGEPGVALRGRVEPGTKLEQTYVFDASGTVRASADGQLLMQGMSTLKSTERIQVEVLTVDANGQAVRSQQTMLEGHESLRYDWADSNPEVYDDKSTLTGLKVLVDQNGKTAQLAQGEPTADQKAELDVFGWSHSMGELPAEPIKADHAWTISDPAQMSEFLGRGDTFESGSSDYLFVGVVPCGTEQCARLDNSFSITFSEPTEGGSIKMTMTGSGHELRSLATGLVVEHRGLYKLVGKETDKDGIVVDFVLTGTVEGAEAIAG